MSEEFQQPPIETAFSIPDNFLFPQPEIDPVIEKNVKTRKAAEEAIDFIKEESSENLCLRFWETILKSAQEEIDKLKPKEPEVVQEEPVQEEPRMTKKEMEAFLKEKFPYGKYVDKTVAFVSKKDFNYLLDFGLKPHWFQAKLNKYLASKLTKRKK